MLREKEQGEDDDFANMDSQDQKECVGVEMKDLDGEERGPKESEGDRV